MAESKGSLLARSVQKHAGRAKEKFLHNLGKVDRTSDGIFEEHLSNFNRQQTNANRLQKEFNNYIRCIRAVQNASKSLMDAIADVYESQWTGAEALNAQMSAIEVLWQDFSHKLGDQVLIPLNTYTAQFPEMKKKIEKRNRKLLDFDNQRHSFEGIQANAAKRKDDVKITKGREQLEEARRTFELLNSELHDELPALFDSRILFLVTNLQTLFASEQVFHNETNKIYGELEAIVDKLATESQRGSYTLKKSNANTTPSSPTQSPVKAIANSTSVNNNSPSSYPTPITNGSSTNLNSQIAASPTIYVHDQPKVLFTFPGSNTTTTTTSTTPDSQTTTETTTTTDTNTITTTSNTTITRAIVEQEPSASPTKPQPPANLPINNPATCSSSTFINEINNNQTETPSTTTTTAEKNPPANDNINTENVDSNHDQETSLSTVSASTPSSPIKSPSSPVDSFHLNNNKNGAVSSSYGNLATSRTTEDLDTDNNNEPSYQNTTAAIKGERNAEKDEDKDTDENCLNNNSSSLPRASSKIAEAGGDNLAPAASSNGPSPITETVPNGNNEVSTTTTTLTATAGNEQMANQYNNLYDNQEVMLTMMRMGVDGMQNVINPAQLYDIPIATNGATKTDLPPGCLYRVQATYRYIKEDVDELSFEVGDIIRVIEYDDPEDQEEGWLMGTKENSTEKGLFPANFTRPL